MMGLLRGLRILMPFSFRSYKMAILGSVCLAWSSLGIWGWTVWSPNPTTVGPWANHFKGVFSSSPEKWGYAIHPSRLGMRRCERGHNCDSASDGKL